MPAVTIPLAATVIAFVAGLLGPLQFLLRGDLQGPLGVVPPALVELVCIALAPVFALVVGASLAAAVRDRFRLLTARVGVGLAVGLVAAFAGRLGTGLLPSVATDVVVDGLGATSVQVLAVVVGTASGTTARTDP